jgi:hypothetical protein
MEHRFVSTGKPVFSSPIASFGSESPPPGAVFPRAIPFIYNTLNSSRTRKQGKKNEGEEESAAKPWRKCSAKTPPAR